jgi:spore coat polysaccharide biosynthesis protein SpsF (cytidylyltransferase family)
MKKKIVLIIQARNGSVRFPKKTIAKFCGKTLIEHILYRVKNAKKIDEIVLATTKKKEDKILSKIALKNKVSFFSGSENDLVSRYYHAAKNFNAYYVLRLPADNPLPDHEEYDRLINYHIKSNNDFSSNICNFMNNGYPDGIGVEIFNYHSLKRIYNNQKNKRFREHLALNFFDYSKNKINKQFNFKVGTIKCPLKKSCVDLKLDVNFKEDLVFIKKIYSFFRNKKYFLSREIVNWYKNVYLKKINNG